MNKHTYIEIYNLIDDAGRYARSKEQELLDDLCNPDFKITCDFIDKIKRAHEKAKEYESLLERFETEVEEPR